MKPLYSFPKIFNSADCRYGAMLYPAQDAYVGKSLEHYGEFSEGEAEIFKALVHPGDIVVEAGANIGAHTVLLARLAGKEGAVLAFEPQPMLYMVLCANIALNGVINVKAEKAGLGNRSQTLHIPHLDYGAAHNFGGISLDLVEEGTPVPIRRLDSYGLQRCSLIKIDVEGMEHQVIEGGANTIHNLRPVLYVENDRQEKSPALIQLLQAMGYSLWWHITPLFKPDNHACNPTNIFAGTVSINMLCIHAEKVDDAMAALTAPMRPVNGPQDWWQ